MAIVHDMGWQISVNPCSAHVTVCYPGDKGEIKIERHGDTYRVSMLNQDGSTVAATYAKQEELK